MRCRFLNISAPNEKSLSVDLSESCLAPRDEKQKENRRVEMMPGTLTLTFSLLFFVAFSCAAQISQMKIISPAFGEGKMIPAQFTCKGKDVSPSLQWSGISEKAKSLALISDDPDAPGGTWVHWVYFNIPPTLTGLPENVAKIKNPETGGIQGLNDFGKVGYGGPCPPSGVHRYYFKLYALDTLLTLDAGTTKDKLLRAMEGHILAQGELMGKFSR
jgi:Raf kinase inhibitor-like YbhB/YbcL family protein